jgi:acyl dehydratase
MQTFATGTVWAALANLAGLNAIPVSSALEYAAPVEIGDTITAIAEAEERTREGSLKVRLYFQNHRGQLVAEGWALMGAES